MDAVHAGFFENVLDNASLAGCSEEYLVDELLARMLEGVSSMPTTSPPEDITCGVAPGNSMNP